MPAQPYTPDTLLLELHEDLSAFMAANRGHLSVAGEMYDFLQLLTESPAGWRVVLLWEGEENPGDNAEAGCFAANKFSLGVTANLGMTASPEIGLIKPSASRPALLQLVAAVRDWTRGHVFRQGVSTKYPLYKGADPVVLPDGMPLKAYRLRFELTLGLPPVLSRE
jgi:hypothetical protein